MHVVPIDDIIVHEESAGCPCGPMVDDDGVVWHCRLGHLEVDAPRLGLTHLIVTLTAVVFATISIVVLLTRFLHAKA